VYYGVYMSRISKKPSSSCRRFVHKNYIKPVFERFYIAPRDKKYCNLVCAYVCSVTVCLSVCPLTYIVNACPNFIKFSVHVSRDCASVLLWQQRNMLYTSGFVDDITFSYNGANGADSNAVMFRRVLQGRQRERRLMSTFALFAVLSLFIVVNR